MYLPVYGYFGVHSYLHIKVRLKLEDLNVKYNFLWCLPEVSGRSREADFRQTVYRSCHKIHLLCWSCRWRPPPPLSLVYYSRPQKNTPSHLFPPDSGPELEDVRDLQMIKRNIDKQQFNRYDSFIFSLNESYVQYVNYTVNYHTPLVIHIKYHTASRVLPYSEADTSLFVAPDLTRQLRWN